MIHWFVYIRDVITSDLATNKDGGAFTSVHANESPITLRGTAARKITSVQAGISFNGSGKGLPFLGIYFPHQLTDLRDERDGIWDTMGF